MSQVTQNKIQLSESHSDSMSYTHFIWIYLFTAHDQAKGESWFKTTTRHHNVGRGGMMNSKTMLGTDSMFNMYNLRNDAFLAHKPHMCQFWCLLSKNKYVCENLYWLYRRSQRSCVDHIGTQPFLDHYLKIYANFSDYRLKLQGYTCFNFGDHWIQLSTSIKTCIAYFTNTSDRMWTKFKLTHTWTII